MQRLYISAWISTAIALLGYILILTNNYGGAFLFKFGIIAAVTFCLVNAFWLISKRHLSSGASMYCILLLDLFMMFKMLNYEGAIPLFFSGLFFFALAVIAKFVSRSRVRKQGGTPESSFDTPMIYAVATTVLSSVVLVC